MGKAKVGARPVATMGRKCWWKEFRGDRWGETIYEGLKFDIGPSSFLVTKLSHGLRVLPLRSRDLCQDKLFLEFEDNSSRYKSRLVVVPETLVIAARNAVLADEEFQAYEEQFTQLIRQSGAA